MKDRIRKRLIAALVCVNIIINSIPVTFASETDVVQEESGTGITEVVSLREENVKHFDLGNGVYQAVIYDSAVHRLDSNGYWQEINNNLYLNNARSNQTYSGSNDRINFASSLSVNESIFELSENDYAVSMALTSDLMPLNVEQTAVDAIVTNTPESRTVSNCFDTIEEVVQFNNISTVLYEDITEGIDLEYILVGNDVKENIIVKERLESYSYRFALELEGLYPQLTPSGSVLLLDIETNEEKYVIPSPFMYDADSIISFDVSYDLSQENGKWYLTVTADEDWCNASERSFPITIDPTIKVTSGVQDTYISSAYPTTNYGSNGQLWISNPPSERDTSVTYLRFDIPNIPEGSSITGATINTYYCYPEYVTDGHITVGAYEMQFAWTESGLTWNMAKNCGSTLGTSSTCLGTAYAEGGIGAHPYSPEVLSIPITSLVQSWYSGRANYGLALKYIVGDNWSVIFKSSENTTGNYCPWINITYTVPDYTFSDGIYRIQNMSANTFVAAQSVSIADYTPAELLPENRTAPYAYGQMWKIQKVSGDYYSVRPMHAPEMVLTATGSHTVKLRDTGSTDSSVLTNNDLWIISHNDTGYEFINKASGRALTPGETALVTLAYSSDNATQNWKLNPVTNITPALLLYNTSTGELISSSKEGADSEPVYITYSSGTLSLAQIGVELVIVDTSSSNHTVVWDSSNSSISRIDLTTGEITCMAVGGTDITVSLQIDNAFYYLSFPLITTAPLNGEYYLYNHYYDASLSSSCLAYIDDAVATANVVYFRLFDIAYGSNGAPLYNSSFTSGHKDVYSILNQLQSLDHGTNEIEVLWTDYAEGAYCNHQFVTECNPFVASGASLVGENAILMTDLISENESEAYLRAYMSILLVHETAHIIGISDCYDIPSHTENGYQCAMEWVLEGKYADDFYHNIRMGYIDGFCDTCISTIQNKLSERN